MFLRWCRNGQLYCSRRRPLAARVRRAWLFMEGLEERTLLSTFPLAPVEQPQGTAQFMAAEPGTEADPLGSPTPVGLLPAQVRHAYGIDQIAFNGVVGDGSGQTIAIVDAYDDPNIAGDLQAFDQQFGLPNPIFTKVAQDGSTNYPPPNSGWITEISLDVEWSHAIAPGANILLVEAEDNSSGNINTAVDYARTQPGVVAVSMSYGQPEFSDETAEDSLFTTPAGHNGVTFLSASGDGGKPGLYQAYSPNVVAVGGTLLSVDSANNYKSETGWSGSGGGISLYEAQPAYQNGVVTQSTTQRTIPDVSIIGGTGVAVYNSYDNGSAKPWQAVAGTSLSTPTWAGLIAIADQGRALNGELPLDGATQTLPALYQLPASDFHDITSGNNGYAAGPGYDLVTGRGTPIAYLLETDLVQAPVTCTWTGAGPDSDWSDPLNWAGNIAPSPGDLLVFGPGAGQLTSTNDYPAGTTFNSIRFTSAGYTVSGNDLVLDNGLDGTSATGANSFNINIALTSDSTINGGYGSTTLTVGGNIDDGGNTVRVGGGTGTVTLSGIISGTGGLDDYDSGTLVLSGNNSYTGNSVLNGNGILALASGTALGSGNLVLDGGTLEASGGAQTLANPIIVSANVAVGGTSSLTLIGAVTLTGNCTLAVSSTGTTTLSGGVGQSGGTWALTKAGTGLLVLAAAGSYGGGTILSAGSLGVGNASALGSGGLTVTGGTLLARGGSVSLANTVTLNGNLTIGGTNSLTLTGALILTGNRTLTVTSGTTTLSGGVGQSGGTWALTKAGGGLLALPIANTYEGGTILNGGTLQIGDPGALGGGTLTFSSGTIEGNGSPLSVPNAVMLAGNTSVGGTSSLTFSGAVTLTGNRTLTVNNTGGTTLAGGVGQSGGNWALTKAGNGLLVLPIADGYAGGTTLNGGTLQVGDPGALGSGILTLTSGTIAGSGVPLALANGLTLSGNVSVGGTSDLTFSGAATLTGNRSLTISNTGTTTLSGGVAQSGGTWGFTKAGNGLLILSSAASYAGTTTLSAGTLGAGNNTALGTGTLAFNGGTLLASGGPVTLGNAVTLSGSATVAGANDLTLSGSVTLTGNRTLTINNTGTTTLSGGVGQSGGSWSFTKAGAGLLVVTATGSYGGGTTLSAGTLSVANALALGTGKLILSGGTLEASGGPMALANTVTISANVVLGGANNLTLTGAVTLQGSRTLTVTNTGTTAVSGAIGQSGTSKLTEAGSGVLVLSGVNTYTGGTTVSSGTLLIDGSQAAGGVTVDSGATLGGSGTTGPVTVAAGGTVEPGATIGTQVLNTTNLALDSNSTFAALLNGTSPGTGYDQINVSGTVSLNNSTLNLSVGAGFTPAIGSTFTLINNDGADPVTGAFQGLAEGATFIVAGMTFQISYVGGTGNDVTVTRTA
jgi:autotransporter-associated beta strand protein